MGGKFAAEFLLTLLAKRREKKRRRRLEAESRSTEGAFQYEDEAMGDLLKGGLKSKMVWLGLAQLAYSLVDLWAHDGLTVQAATSAVFGALTIIGRVVTSESLAQKAK